MCVTENTEKTETTPEKPAGEPSKSPKKDGCCLKMILIFVLLFVLLIAGIIGAGWWALNKFLGSSAGSNLPTTATVEILSGTAEKAPDGTSWQPVQNGETVQVGTSIKTGSKSQTEITFPSGSQLRLDENTQITLSSSDTGNTSLTQSTGRTWSRIGKLLGKDESYEIDSQTTLATVRGTAFTFIVSEEESMVDTDDGQVTVAAIEKVGQERKILHKIIVGKGFAAGIAKRDLEDIKAGRKQLIKQAISEEISNSEWFKKNRERDVKFLQRLKQKGVKPTEILNLIRSVSPADILKLQQLAQKMGNGEIKPTEAQIDEFARITQDVESNGMTYADAQSLARLAASVDPGNFSDTNHWTNVFKHIEILMRIRLQQQVNPESRINRRSTS